MSVLQSNDCPILVFATPQRKQWTELAGRPQYKEHHRLPAPELKVRMQIEEPSSEVFASSIHLTLLDSFQKYLHLVFWQSNPSCPRTYQVTWAIVQM